MPTLFLYFFLFLFTTTVTKLIPTVHSNCIEAHRQSLLHFKQSLVLFDSSKSSKLITWNSSTECCSWLGVTCSTNGSVVGLDISNESISCYIDNSSSLFQLQHLQSLNLADNDFRSSSIPPAIGKLTELRYLNLRDASFSGVIPIEISRLTRLITLDLSRNGYHSLEVENPNLSMLIQNLTELTELYLDLVWMRGLGSDWCEAISSSLPKLRVLSFSEGDLSGPICESLAKLQSLYEIDLSSNSFYAPVPRVFANFSNLTYLSLYNSNLLGTFPKEIFQIPSLQTIHLFENFDLNGSFPEFPNNGSLRSLIVDGVSFSGDLPNSIGNLKMLSSIDISKCNFTGSVPKSIENLTQLAYLDMSGNIFNSPISSIHWETLVNLETLDLSNNQLYGTIPSSVVSLPKLERLTLSHNRFSGQVPEFSNTSSHLLDTLDLENNNLEGQIPTSIFNLQGLTSLQLSSNNFNGFPFLRNQSILFYFLDLSNNQIQGEIPNWILSLKSPLSLDLSGNSLASLEAPLPNSTSALSSLDLRSNKLQDIHSSYSFLQLDYLGLASNKLTTFPDFLRNQSHLTDLDLSDNQIQGQIPNWIWILDSLQKLNLSCNSLESLEAPLVNSTYVLSSVDLHSNQLQGHFPLFLTSSYLDYSRNNFSSSIPTDIGDFMIDFDDLLANGFYLSLSSNNFHGAIPKSICNLRVEVLDLSNNTLSGNIPQCLTQLFSLSVIDLGRNNLSGTIPDNFLNGSRLQTLDLSNNQIQGRFPKSLVNCSRLKVLDIGNNNITDTFPCVLMSISTLRVLVLQSNKFYGSIGCPKTNDTWPVLQIIDLAHNNFSGDMPGRMSLSWHAMVSNDDDSRTNVEYSYYPTSRNMKTHSRGGGSYFIIYYRDAITTTIKGLELDVVRILTIFTLIDYSSNKFNGSIPEEIGELKSLYVLNLSGNTFTGKIPSSFGKMRQLESLDLSKNHLSGQIPPQFANLTFLAFLDLSNNELVGKIPTSTQISTFPNTSFEGNKGLWGPPLTVDAVLPPPISNGSSSHPNSGDEIDWDVICVEIGFTCGFGIVIGSLLFCKSWRKWYYRTMRSILFKIFPQLEQRFGNHRRHVYVNVRR
ncbi:putative leucine-rich repeat-containing, plant-type, leucine-rich repeat domain, L [Rosa chinensis]|uniref:Putative leucine-rich repeat-containing, plant-type, leucine-rich repeat domain, L n=1 Tax=Rosa chinensis TaxID=74649 RepID=A0A2P6RDX6_ROSCH|nr:receptor-like protein 7 [Rosa chinensis]PRQ44615.1 putative leucine-rich repeat-containing, plant-type, leucine-rich repeat domain, L [Rosa chinensis]